MIDLSKRSAVLAITLGLGSVNCGRGVDELGDLLPPWTRDGGVSHGSDGRGQEHPPSDPQTCASPPTGDWEGMASILLAGAGSSYTVRADVRWTLATSQACVDRYRPSGTASFDFSGNCALTITPSSTAVQPADGELIIDRTTSTPTYRMTGATNWDAVSACPQEDPSPTRVGGPWANDHGSFDGAVISGGINNFPEVIAWRFTRVGASFPSPGGGCSQPPSESWTGTASVSFAASVSVTWNRTSTSECVDTFVPTGLASQPPPVSPCPGLVYDPPTYAVVPYDGFLEIDRSTNPPSFTMAGLTMWDGTLTCTREGGEVQTFPGSVGGYWGLYSGAFDGNRFSGGAVGEAPNAYDWSLSRVP